MGVVARLGFQAVVCLLRELRLLSLASPGQDCPRLALLEPELSS